MTEKCTSCDQMKKENKRMRQAMTETSTNYTEVVNENLALRRQISELEKGANKQEIVFTETVYPDPRTVDTSESTESTCADNCKCSTCFLPPNLDHPQIGAN